MHKMITRGHRNCQADAGVLHYHLLHVRRDNRLNAGGPFWVPLSRRSGWSVPSQPLRWRWRDHVSLPALCIPLEEACRTGVGGWGALNSMVSVLDYPAAEHHVAPVEDDRLPRSNSHLGLGEPDTSLAAAGRRHHGLSARMTVPYLRDNLQGL